MNRAALLSLSHGDLIALVQAQQAQIEAQAQQISVLTARIVELEGRLAAPAKTPDNSSIPPSKGQKSNLPDRPKKPRGGHPGVARALAEHPDRIIEATLAACPHCAHAFGPADLLDIHAYDHIDLPPLRPIVTRVNRHRGICSCCQKRVGAPAPEGFEAGSPFGPGLSALIIHLHVTQAIGFQRLARLMVRLAEGERGDAAAVRRWLTAAAEADPEPGWRCTRCGTLVSAWQANCPHCRAFDTLTWQAPLRAAAPSVLVQGPVAGALPAPVASGASPPTAAAPVRLPGTATRPATPVPNAPGPAAPPTAPVDAARLVN